MAEPVIHSKRTARRPWFLQSRTRLFLTLFLVLAIPTSIFIALSVHLVSGELTRQAVAQNSMAAALVSRQLEDEFFGIRRYVESYASRRRLVDAVMRNDSEVVQEQLSEMVEQNRKLSRAIFTDTNGVLRSDYPPDPSVLGKNFSQRAWFEGTLRSDRPFVSPIYRRSAFDQALVVMIAAKVTDTSGHLLGYLGAHYAVEDLATWLESIKPAVAGKVTFLDQNGNVPSQEDAIRANSFAKHPVLKEILDRGSGSVRVANFDGYEECVLSYTTAPTLNWTIISYQPTEVIFGPIERLLRSLFLFFGMALAALGFLGLVWYKVIFAYSEDLLRANKELESFCYTIAHDLRGPLRAMQGFTSMLCEEYGEQLDTAGKDYARRITSSARRMDRLVMDLLNYGHFAHTSLIFRSVSLDESVCTAVESVRSEIDERGADIKIKTPLGVVSADPTLIDSVLHHLLSNAIQYVPPGRKPEIEIGSERKDLWVRLWIKDNGIGIPPDQQEKIFGVFQRLNPQDAYTGTGIGLAIVKKAVERLGGRVGVDSELGKGSRFWIELPTR